MQVVFVGTKAQGLHGNGKQFNFIRVAYPVLLGFGHQVYIIDSLYKIYAVDRDIPTLVCLVYNEEGIIEPEIVEIEYLVKRHFKDLRILHEYKQGSIIGNKMLTHELLCKGGVPTPQVVHSTSANFAVLSRSILGSGLPVKVFAPGVDLDTSKINTAYVDTTFSYKGVEYLVCLRFMCFWKQHVCTYVRCRRASDGDPSVHTATTPVNADLLNHLFSHVVTPRSIEIIDTCRRAGDALGPGFYSHDVLPPSAGGPLVFCETGYKYDEMFLSVHLRKLAGQLLMPDAFNDIESLRMAHALCLDIERIPQWEAID